MIAMKTRTTMIRWMMIRMMIRVRRRNPHRPFRKMKTEVLTQGRQKIQMSRLSSQIHPKVLILPNTKMSLRDMIQQTSLSLCSTARSARFLVQSWSHTLSTSTLWFPTLWNPSPNKWEFCSHILLTVTNWTPKTRSCSTRIWRSRFVMIKNKFWKSFTITRCLIRIWLLASRFMIPRTFTTPLSTLWKQLESESSHPIVANGTSCGLESANLKFSRTPPNTKR